MSITKARKVKMVSQVRGAEKKRALRRAAVQTVSTNSARYVFGDECRVFAKPLCKG
ncbi:uncharacterized protein VDAG_01214 [Verticillium dahliae VdLs.17]|uniref:Uncharacterized protein n=1 Tax=Verticillium dahliae (strain VdLs.17 / ATCC MYA-4575 / FGSC 10137) TaxID=498257 RepID=G2WTU1_VERDV|nr:uncharacterized protein VDAG_01214 [Verticillium dahliae VdLs.17]EGY17532.1 hypothetical protein VDAG_01214 [Verticillium dahliae VdLs.17]